MGGRIKSVRQLACYLPDPILQCLHFCERVAPDNAQGMHSPCIQVWGVVFFFFFLAPSNVVMFDRSDLFSCNEPLGKKRDKCSYLSPQILLLGDELCYSAFALTNAPQCISLQMCFLFIFK